MKKLFFITMLLMLTICSYGTTYYVATTGNNGNAGTSTGSPWATLTYAMGGSSPVTQGDTVYVKAGNYGNENIVCTKNGTQNNLIVVKGYVTTPGDQPIIAVNKADTSAALVTSAMPTYTGTSRTSGICIDMEGVEYVAMINLQITAYAYGIIAGEATAKKGIELDNISVHTIGDPNASYSGLGIRFGSPSTKFNKYCKLRRILVVNSCAEGISFAGNNSVIDSCFVYNNDNTLNARTDYFYFVQGDYNSITNCKLWQPPSTSSGNHGFSLKSNREQVIDLGLPYAIQGCYRNKIRFCTAYNINESFVFRHRDVRENLVEYCEAYGTQTLGGAAGNGNGVVIRDGASDNIVRYCKFKDCFSGIKFQDTSEDGGAQLCGYRNVISNCIIDNCYYGVDATSTGVASEAGNNLISNCSFYLSRYVIRANRSCDSLRFVGNIFQGSSGLGYGGEWYTGTNTGDIIPNGSTAYFKDCDYYNIEGGMPTNFVTNTVGGISGNPLFNDPSNGDFTLQSSSPCIDACDNIESETVKTAPYCHLEHIDPMLSFLCSNRNHLRNKPHVWRDYVGTLCPVGSYADMGAYEYKP